METPSTELTDQADVLVELVDVLGAIVVDDEKLIRNSESMEDDSGSRIIF